MGATAAAHQSGARARIQGQVFGKNPNRNEHQTRRYRSIAPLQLSHGSSALGSLPAERCVRQASPFVLRLKGHGRLLLDEPTGCSPCVTIAYAESFDRTELNDVTFETEGE